VTMRVVSTACIAAALGLGAVALGTVDARAAGGPLRLCVDPANLPFSSDGSDAARSGPTGLYVEIGQAIAEALHRPAEYVWSLTYFGKRNLRLTLLDGKCDLAIGLPAEKDFMGPRVVFSRPILTLGYALVGPRAGPPLRVEDLAGRRVAVQFGSPPQSLLAERGGVTLVTTLNPEDAMRRLAAGEVDAAFIWGPSAGYVNHAQLHDAFRVDPVDGPQMSWPAAIGFSSKQPGLRDEVDAVLDGLAPRIRALADRYAVAQPSASPTPR
jgi:polar amino acid transport system substrate-binding protein